MKEQEIHLEQEFNVTAALDVLKRNVFHVFMTVMILVGGTCPAAAVTYTFNQITENGTVDVSDQLTVDVQDSGNDAVSFTFYNDVGQQSSITDIYFSGTSGLLVVPGEITDQTDGVSFSTGATPPNLPGGKDYDFSASVGADSNPPTQPNGVNAADEYVTWTFALASGMTFQDVISALDSGALQIGLHVQGYADGSSESFLYGCSGGSGCGQAPAIPLPASIWLMFGALGSLAFLSRRGRRPRKS
jgi:hypothetical protein